VPNEGIWPNSTITEDENAALAQVHAAMVAACDATPKDITDEQLVASGWPLLTAQQARAALKLMIARGRHDEEQEEELPSETEWP
jgi:hypothetical protein